MEIKKIILSVLFVSIGISTCYLLFNRATFLFVFQGYLSGSENIKLGYNYYSRYYGRDYADIVSLIPAKVLICPTVVSCSNNKEFILVKQKPKYSEFKTVIIAKLINNPGPFTDSMWNNANEKADSMLTHDSFYVRILSHEYNYWIILQVGDEAYGPLMKQEYLQKRIELKVPSNLILNET